MNRVVSRHEREKDATVYVRRENAPVEERKHGHTQGLPPWAIPDAEVIVGRVKLSRYNSTGRCDVEVDGFPTSGDDAMSAIFDELQHVALARDKAMRPTEGVTLEGDAALVDGDAQPASEAPALPLAKASQRLKAEGK
jgi:hypothetical protein